MTQTLLPDQTDVIDRAARLQGHVTVDNASIPVNGTFWQATQPVSGTVTANVGTTGGLALDATLTGGTARAKVTDGTNNAAVKAASVAAVATDPALVVAVSPNNTVGVTGTITGNQGTANTVANAWPTKLTDGTNTLTVKAGSSAASANTDPMITVGLRPDSNSVFTNPPTLTKGTQNPSGYSVQALKDAGRAQVMLSWEEMAGTSAVESTLTNFTLGSNNAAALTAATSYTVTAAKRLRIQTISIYLKNTTGTAQNVARFRIRQAASAIANTSPVIFDAVLVLESNALPVSGAGGKIQNIVIPDGLEVAAGQQITFTWNTAANTCTVGLSIVGYEY